MKFVSILFFVAALTLTWKIMDYEPAIAVETHTQIQTELEKVIRATIEKSRPKAQDIYFEKMWTENIAPTRVLAHFEYSFSEAAENGEVVQQTVKGQAFLDRQGSADPNEDAWALDEVTVNDATLEFTEGTVITPQQSPSTP